MGQRGRSALWSASVLFLFVAVFVEGVVAGSKRDAASVLNTTARIHVAPSIAAGVAIAVGTVVCFFGFKLLRPVVFLCGFIAGGLAIALIIEYAFPGAPWMATASWIGFVAAGTITGFMVLMLYNVGLFLVGVVAGALLAFTLNTSFGHKIWPSQPDIMLVIMVLVLSLFFGILAWKLEKPMVIITTSFIGATAVVWGVGYFAGSYPSGANLKRFRHKDPQGAWVYRLPGTWWAYLAANAVLFLVGVVIQWRKNSSGSAQPRPRPVTTATSPGPSPVYQAAVTPPGARAAPRRHMV